RKHQKAGTLSGGEQQMCAIGRALMARPKLLMLDEPSMGLAPIFVERIFETVVEVNKQGTPILLAEQNTLMAVAVADRAYVLETGEEPVHGNEAELARGGRVGAAADEHGAGPVERRLARVPVPERQQRMDGAAGPVALDRPRVGGGCALRLHEPLRLPAELRG